MFELAWSPAGVARKNTEPVKRLEQIERFVFEIDGADHAGERGPPGQCVRRS